MTTYFVRTAKEWRSMVSHHTSIRRLLVGGACLLVCCTVLTGCSENGDSSSANRGGGQPDQGKSAQPNQPDSDRALPNLSAQEFLQQVFLRYRNSRSYRDLGEVRLRVERDGRLTTRVAPMHVALSGSTIWVAAYDARLWSDEEQTVGWIADPGSDFYDSQVVLGGSVATGDAIDRPVLDQLLSDGIVTDRMTAGLGGPPPQLEWLLDANPMAKLFDRDPDADTDSAPPKIAYDRIATHRDVYCVVVQANVGNATYRFWIERERSLIHRVELPVSIAGQSVHLAGWTVRSLDLMLNEATFATPPNRYRMLLMPKADFPQHPKYVRALIPLPPDPPHRLVGGRLDSFRQQDLSNRQTLTQRGAGLPFTLWLICKQTDGSEAEITNRQSVLQMASWFQRNASFFAEHVRPVAVADAKLGAELKRAGLETAGWMILDDQSGVFTGLSKEASPVAVLTDNQGQILWVTQSDQIAQIETLPSVVGDALAGIDIPKRLNQLWRQDRQAYEKKLAEVAIKNLGR